MDPKVLEFIPSTTDSSNNTGVLPLPPPPVYSKIDNEEAVREYLSSNGWSKGVAITNIYFWNISYFI